MRHTDYLSQKKVINKIDYIFVITKYDKWKFNDTYVSNKLLIKISVNIGDYYIISRIKQFEQVTIWP